MTNWGKIIRANRSKIEETIEEAIKEAYMEYLDTAKGYIEVSLNKEGIPAIYRIDENETAADIKNGVEIFIGRFRVKEDLELDLNEFLEGDDRKNFKSWCRENDVEPSDHYIEEWDEEIYQEIAEEAILCEYEYQTEEIHNLVQETVEEALRANPDPRRLSPEAVEEIKKNYKGGN